MEKAINYHQFLENPVFVLRYIDQNMEWYASYLAGKRGIGRIFRYPYACLMKKFFLNNYFQRRVLRGIIDIPYVEVVLTTKCTLRCEHCANLMQYTCSLDSVIESLECLCQKVASIGKLRLIGGEPFLFKDMPQLLDYVESKTQILTYDIVTNASIDIKEPILQRLAKSKKNCKVSISDYSHVEGIRLKQTSIFENLKKYNVPFSFLKGGTWLKLERIHKRNRNKEQNVASFLACYQRKCTSLIGGGTPKGAIFVCGMASSLSKLKGLEEFQGEYIDLMRDEPIKFLEFYTRDFYQFCDYCQDYSKPTESIPSAAQTREVLQIK